MLRVLWVPVFSFGRFSFTKRGTNQNWDAQVDWHGIEPHTLTIDQGLELPPENVWCLRLPLQETGQVYGAIPISAPQTRLVIPKQKVSDSKSNGGPFEKNPATRQKGREYVRTEQTYITNKSYIDPWGMLTQHFVCACDRIGPLKYSKKNWSHWIACMPLENLTRIKKKQLYYNCWRILTDLNGLAKRVANAFWHPVWARLRLTASAPGLSQSWGIAYGRSQSARCFRYLSMSFSRNHWRSSYHLIFPSCGIPRSRAFLDPSSTSPLPIIYS